MRLYHYILILLFFTSNTFSQVTLPIYSDYLSDNVYLIHPAAAGIGNCGKIRFTARQQWAGIPNAPTLQTLSFHRKFNENSNTGLGLIVFNDKNGFHSQIGIQGTYTYHIPLSDGRLFEQLSFGLSYSVVFNKSDQRQFVDPAVAQLIESTTYYNGDFGVAYHRGGFSSYFTIKNLLLSTKNNLKAGLEPLNLRNYIVSLGYYFGKGKYLQLEPSVMVQYKEVTGERIVDVNMKAYKTFKNINAWLTLSYRRSFDVNPIQNYQYITPVFGVNYNNMMFSYTYTKQINDLVLTKSGFHQITVGFDLFCFRPSLTACPNINASFGGSYKN